ncbi:MAG: DUF7557 family protein [Nanobdellota archaeon]
MMKTIAVDDKVHKKVSEFGHKNETYSEIIERMYDSANEAQYAEMFLDTKNTVGLKDLEW